MNTPLDVSKLNDPVYVGQAMMRGQIARLTQAHARIMFEAELERAAAEQHAAQQQQLGRTLKRLDQARNRIAALVVMNIGVMLATAALAWWVQP